MGEKIISVDGGGSASDETRKAVGGWRAMQQLKSGKDVPVESRQQRLLREQEEKADRIRRGVKENPDKNYRPGEEDANEEFNMKRMKQHVKLLTESKKVQKTFKGKPDLCMTKLVMLFNGEDEIAPKKNLTIINVEQAGFNEWKITYTCD